MIAIVLGTRPEIIKMSPIVRACERRGLDYYILHTGQHYSYEMDRAFFDDLELPEPRYNLEVGSGNDGAQTTEPSEAFLRTADQYSYSLSVVGPEQQYPMGGNNYPVPSVPAQ